MHKTTEPRQWTRALQRLSERIAPQNYDMWLRPIECVAIEGSRVRLRAPNPYVRLWFESNYLPSILDELRHESDDALKVEFEEEYNAEPPPPEPEPARPEPREFSLSAVPTAAHASPFGGADGAGLAAGTGSTFAASNAPTLGDGTGRMQAVTVPDHRRATSSDDDAYQTAPTASLNPRYTFNSFVSGPSNQLAFAASQAAASTYPPKYNPIFICGGVGLGKTHLLHAVGHEISARRPNARILYLSGERFMNEYIHAIRTTRMHEFRKRYRESCDVLLVDDVQFLAGKDGTQDEFFHTFNALHDGHRQIVLTADRKPHEISDIADRLRTRFAWGLMADIEPPELEVRVAILRKKAAAEQISLPDDVALYIATAIKSNVRELEGALIRLAAYASLSNRPIDADFARETLEGSITRPQEPITVDAVLKSVASYYGLKVSDLKSPRRHKSIAGPRAVAMYLARRHTKQSYPDLGRSFGGKHHTTVISAVDKTDRRLKTDPTLRGEIHAIESMLLH